MFCLVLYTLGFGLLLQVGSLSQIYLFGFSIMTVILLGLRIGLASVAVGALTLLGVGWIGHAATEVGTYDLAGWLVISLNFAVINTLLTLTVGAVLAAVTKAIADRKHAEADRLRIAEQLRQAQKMEAVGQLAGGVAHDFNNLLSVILSCSEFLLEDMAVGDAMRHDVDQIHHAGMRAAELTRQLLMFSRHQVVEPKVLDLNELLSGVDKMLQRVVGEHIALTKISETPLGCVRADPGSIEQVIMNLVVNARDAMPIGGRLTMETANVTLDETFAATHLGANHGPHVMLSVSDTGSGMDEATLARIFEPFFTTKEKGKGTGLGLSTVFGIVQRHHGTVWVDSEVGRGTTFKVYLPRIDEAADSRTAVAVTTRRGSETILLVEDEDQVREVADGILRRHGYTVLAARTAGEALLCCEQHVGPIHLLLSDVVMPQMSGPLLAKRLVAMRPDMRVLCMSGYTDDAAVRHGVIDAELAYLQKPITVEALTGKVRSVLDDLGPKRRAVDGASVALALA
jgi:signal transduction histidine kinase/ActR/RegA family two-component response regulator